MKSEGKVVTANRTAALPALFVLVLGIGVVTIAGHLQASTLHAAAHDTRHAAGFPCH